MTSIEKCVDALDLGDAVIETKGAFPPVKVDIGAGYRQGTNGLSDDD